MDTILEDVFDPRDLLYRPLITPLPPTCEPFDWPEPAHQEGRECVGYALSNIIEIVLREARSRSRWSFPNGGYGVHHDAKPSALMLYKLARRYDDKFGTEGTSYGTSLRAALKGWYHHGVAIGEEWQGERLVNLGFLLDNPDFRSECQKRPLGAYYRVNPFRVDDVQSAICETRGIVVTLTVPDRWVPPGDPPHPPLADADWEETGSLHAVVLIGYNEKGFLALNSYGPQWGERGTGTIPYDAWLRNAVDAWVARVGVPGTLLPDDRTRGGRSTLDGPAAARAPDQRPLKHHVISLGFDGDFSAHGRYVSTESSVNEILLEAARTDNCTHSIVVWFHDSLIGDDDQRWIAIDQIDWWKANGIYPIYFSWRSLFFSRLFEDLGRTLQWEMPITGVQRDMRRQVDRLCELRAERYLAPLWKELLAIASGESAKGIIDRVAKALDGCGKPIHLVGAGVGSHLLLSRLAKVAKSIALLSPTCTVEQLCGFTDEQRKRTTVYLLREETEEKAGCFAAGFEIHSHSFLTLVARSLQQPKDAFYPKDGDALRPEENIVGLARRTRCWANDPCGGTHRIWAPSVECGAKTPRDFSSDPDTLDSLASRILKDRESKPLRYLDWRFGS